MQLNPIFRREAPQQIFRIYFRREALAKKFGVAPEILAHAFVVSRSFVTASIIGGTKIEHLSQAFKALSYDISEELEQDFERLHREYLVPAP